VLISCKISTHTPYLGQPRDSITIELYEELKLTGRIDPSKVFHVPPDSPQEPEERGEDHERQRGVEYELHVSAPQRNRSVAPASSQLANANASARNKAEF
jgi:hypothetical protein